MATRFPGPEGTLSRPVYDTLMTCTVGEDVTVRRVSDQDSEFLRFAERHDLKPGQVVRVEDRDPAADCVKLRGQGREFTIGARAASKVLVEVIGALVLMVLLSSSAFAQAAPAQEIRRALRHHGQLVPRRGSLQPGSGRLSEHRRRGVRERQLVIQLHAGVAARVAGAPVLLQRVGARQRRRIGDRRHAS